MGCNRVTLLKVAPSPVAIKDMAAVQRLIISTCELRHRLLPSPLKNRRQSIFCFNSNVPPPPPAGNEPCSPVEARLIQSARPVLSVGRDIVIAMIFAWYYSHPFPFGNSDFFKKWKYITLSSALKSPTVLRI